MTMFFVFEDFFIVFNHSPCTSFINDSIDVYDRSSQKYKLQVKVKYFSWFYFLVGLQGGVGGVVQTGC